jgi:hypothetical protein
VESQPLTTAKRPGVLDVVALATTVSLVGMVAFLEVKVLPFYVTVMAEGGYQMPFAQRAATWVCSFTVRYVLAGFFFWALYALWRSSRTARPVPFPRPRVLAMVNVAAVVVLMGQVSGFVGFAMHGLKAAHTVITAQEQSRAGQAARPATTPQR